MTACEVQIFCRGDCEERSSTSRMTVVVYSFGQGGLYVTHAIAPAMTSRNSGARRGIHVAVAVLAISRTNLEPCC